MVFHIWSATGLGPLMEAGCRKFDCVHPTLLPGGHLTMRSLRSPLRGNVPRQPAGSVGSRAARRPGMTSSSSWTRQTSLDVSEEQKKRVGAGGASSGTEPKGKGQNESVGSFLRAQKCPRLTWAAWLGGNPGWEHREASCRRLGMAL